MGCRSPAPLQPDTDSHCSTCAQMVEALGGRGSEHALSVLLFTSANTVGRMVAGSVTERLLHRYGVPRCASSTAALPCSRAQAAKE